jgi:hypothetical protein
VPGEFPFVIGDAVRHRDDDAPACQCRPAKLAPAKKQRNPARRNGSSVSHHGGTAQKAVRRGDDHAPDPDRNQAVGPALAADGDLLDSDASRPSRRCRKNASASATTVSSSSRAVQYLAPDGRHTGRSHHRHPGSAPGNDYPPRAPHPLGGAAEPTACRPLRDVTRHASNPRKRVHGVLVLHPGVDQGERCDGAGDRIYPDMT